MARFADESAMRQMLETYPQDLYTDSRRSSAMYSPPASLTRFLRRSMMESVPSLFHCPMSPVRSHPSAVMVSLVTSSRLSVLGQCRSMRRRETHSSPW